VTFSNRITCALRCWPRELFWELLHSAVSAAVDAVWLRTSSAEPEADDLLSTVFVSLLSLSEISSEFAWL
jgi:hypothetical protein